MRIIWIEIQEQFHQEMTECKLPRPKYTDDEIELVKNQTLITIFHEFC